MRTTGAFRNSVCVRWRLLNLLTALSLALGLTLAGGSIAQAGTGLRYHVVDADNAHDGGVFYRNSPHWNDTTRTNGVGGYYGETVELVCGADGDEVGPYHNHRWHLVDNLTRPSAGRGWLPDRYLDTPNSANQPTPNEPECGAAAPAPTPAPAPSVSLSQGPATPAGYRYAITLSNFTANAGISLKCYDSASPGGFYPFTLKADGAGNASTASYCYSGDGPDHWVVANGVESNHVSWGGGLAGGSPAAPSSPPSGPPPSAGPSSPSSGSAPGSPKPGDVCLGTYGDGGRQVSHSILGGFETDYDRKASLYQVCEGFGAPDRLAYSPEMRCALIAAAATYGGPSVNFTVSKACDSAGIANSFAKGDWLGLATGPACGFFSDVFATGVGVFAAGAASETGPGAVVVGVKTYKALAAGLKVACGGIFDGGAATLGYNHEAAHESHVALDVTRAGKCIHMRQRWKFVSWSAANC